MWRERYYLPETLIALLAGVLFSQGATFIRPLEYADGSPQRLEEVTLYFTRLVLDVQLVLAGVQLPNRYLSREWRSLGLLLGPGMISMWIITSLLVWAMVPHLPYVHALAVAACVTPTDPVLSNAIVKGRFAAQEIPEELQRVMIAESGANDGLGYPFLFLALYIVEYSGSGDALDAASSRAIMAHWFGETWAYEILLSIVYGVVVSLVLPRAYRNTHPRLAGLPRWCCNLQSARTSSTTKASPSSRS